MSRILPDKPDGHFFGKENRAIENLSGEEEFYPDRFFRPFSIMYHSEKAPIAPPAP